MQSMDGEDCFYDPFLFPYYFLAGVIYFKLTPDIKPVLDSIQKRFGRS
jgi:hypothetical protein